MLSYKTVFLALILSSSSLALPIRREVPQEHSHQQFLTSVQASLVKNNPLGLVDSVFGLLGNAAASQGLGKLQDDGTCLQQAIADQAFTNAKAAGDVDGQVSALIYRALERNSGSVGAVTAPCTNIKAVNPEIAAIQQHQDPASDNAAAVNKAITLELAKQIASVGGDPQLALKSGTFAPGKIGDPTAKGNTCDDQNDATGCIFTQNLLVEDATADEINAAVAGVSSGSDSSDDSSSSSDDSTATCASAVTVTVTATAGDSAATTVDNSGSATSSASDATVTSGATNIGDFGSCSIPQIEFGVGFDNRKETSFQPVDKKSFNHGSAQAIGIITQFICDTLTNSCGADATAKATCAAAQKAAGAAPPKTGIDADIFNSFFGIATDFRDVEAVDDQGRPIAGSTGGDVTVASVGAAQTGVAANVGASATSVAAATITATSSSIGNFGSCTIPQIEFGVGFDGRKETSFQPVDKKSFNHGSAQAIGIITQFICDTLTNSCGADATAKATCAAAQAAAGAAPPKTGIDADIFNSFFGIATDFRDVEAVDDQGRPIAGSTGGDVTVVATGAVEAATATSAASSSSSTSSSSSSSSSSSTAGNVQTFTGALGGIAAPPVTPGGKGFQIDGAEFINEAGALGRSCDVQHNLCANAANSGNPGFTVSDCDAQNNACHAAITA